MQKYSLLVGFYVKKVSHLNKLDGSYQTFSRGQGNPPTLPLPLYFCNPSISATDCN